MISRIKGKLTKKQESKILIETNGLCYEVCVPKSVSLRLEEYIDKDVEIIIYHYWQMDKNRAIPVMIGFLEELERDFFEVFISVSGIGPKAAIKAFDKPVALIAEAIEKGDINFLKGLGGIGKQKAKQIVAQLQGKVGRFALIKESKIVREEAVKNKEIIEEAKAILRRLQYSGKEIETMISKALESPLEINSVESLLNEIYKRM